MHLTRRSALALGASTLALPRAAFAAGAREVMWEELIPPGVPYAEIIGEGELDLVNDTWNPIYDANGTKLNMELDGAYIRMPGFIVPLEMDGQDVLTFILVPYQGACIHTPPPPANQLVLVETSVPWTLTDYWDAVWVRGTLQATISETDIAQTGYFLNADFIELYQW